MYFISFRTEIFINDLNEHSSMVQTLKEILYDTNVWWDKKENIRHLTEPLKREELKEIVSELDSHRITSVIGPRRTGKTVLLYQTIDHLLKAGVEPKNILFFSLDNSTIRAKTENAPEDIFQMYFNEVLYTRPIELKERVYFIIDEVHKQPDWAEWLKNKYDFFKKIKFIISGSSSLKILKNTQETLPGRTSTIRVFPLSFRQFCELNNLYTQIEDLDSFDFRDMNKLLDTARKNETNYKRIFDNYLKVGGFIEWFKVRDIFKWMKYLHEDIVDKLIVGDIAEEYDVKDLEALRRILLVLSLSQGNLFSYYSLSKEAQVGKDSIENYLNYLKAGFVIFEMANYSTHIGVRLRKNKKMNLIDIGLVNSIRGSPTLSAEGQGTAIEQLVQQHLFYFAEKEGAKLYFYRDKENYEVDAILKIRNKIIPIEVKYKNKMASSDLKGILKVMEKFKTKKGIILTKNVLRKTKRDNKEILYIPVWIFLLSL